MKVPDSVVEVARRALASKPSNVPPVTYRLAAGQAVAGDAQEVALWCLDHADQFNGGRCTVTAALRGGNAGMQWAMTAALASVKDETIGRQLISAVRSDQQLTQQVAAAIVVAWDRQMDHASRKAHSRLGRSTQGRGMTFTGWPNVEVATYTGLDDLMDRAWDAFVASLGGIFAEYARTQSSIVSVVDELGAESVRLAIAARVPAVINSLVSFLDQRAREFIVGDVPYAPQDFMAARTVSAWVSGAGGAPSGFTFNELLLGQFATALTTAQEAILVAASARPERFFTFIHSFYGAPLKPFQPHLDLDGEVFTIDEAATSSLYPADHIGCRCEFVPGWTF